MSLNAPMTAAPWLVPLDLHSATPVYVQVAQGLRERIEQGELPVGSALPAERELAANLHVSRVTVRQALALLAEQGLLSRKHGSGTFITPPQTAELPSHSLGLLSSFSGDVTSRGQRPGARVLTFEHTRPTAQEAMSLGLSPTEFVYRIRRLRTADGEPLALEQSTLPVVLVGHITAQDVTDASLYALLGTRGLQPQRAIRHLRAVNADADAAGLLEVSVGTAMLSTERLSWTNRNRPIEFARALYRGDRYDFVMELHAQDGA
ncbi:GntR family transcriptional regulator [Deinococcus fonticola]|uniref:GntR family transcriptional regulator n=1 Tax=Deinococcus fonticola TaxID=2528713 RepID=UPI001F113519|nr:GntR family transcriptional regulator [Deinococcus fonticola]